MKKLKLLLLTLFLLLFYSCRDETKFQLSGQWIIEEIKFNHIDAKPYLLSNAFNLKWDETCVLPRRHPIENKNGNWCYIVNDSSLLLITNIENNYLFNDTFYVEFKEENQMNLYSDSLKMKCIKMFNGK